LSCRSRICPSIFRTSPACDTGLAQPRPHSPRLPKGLGVQARRDDPLRQVRHDNLPRGGASGPPSGTSAAPVHHRVQPLSSAPRPPAPHPWA
jgi:hypothetical protein